MIPYSCMTREELKKEYEHVLAHYAECKAQGLKLDMSHAVGSGQRYFECHDYH